MGIESDELSSRFWIISLQSILNDINYQTKEASDSIWGERPPTGRPEWSRPCEEPVSLRSTSC